MSTLSTPLKSANIQLVIFDCDGVLVDSEGLSKRVLLQMLAGIGVVASDAYFDQHFLGRSYEAVTASIFNDYSVTLPATFQHEYQTQLLQVFAQELRPTIALTQMLAQLTLPYCVATSSSPNRVDFALKSTNLIDYFAGQVFTASEVKNGKPAPDLFLHAAKQMGMAPQNCLVIEDSQAGIEAGLAANMHVIKYAGASHLVNKAASTNDKQNKILIIREWPELFSYIPSAR